jgi:hypothetical protein
VLQGERAHNGAVARGSVGVAVAPVVGQKNLGEAAIGGTGRSCRCIAVRQPADRRSRRDGD